MKIKKFKNYISEEVSGTELVGPIGPSYGETRIQNKTINNHHTTVILSNITNKLYTIDEYNDIYNEYLKLGGSPLCGFNSDNLDMILSFFN